MSSPLDFTPARDRDAQASIRGYVYQVDTTILRWLELGSEEFLEPESGEDIDKVCTALEEGPTRLLEQVKHREKNITLRSPAALETLACAVEHLEANPNQELFFRFTSNASPGLEREPRIGDREKAIVVWERLRTDGPSEERQAVLAELRDFLLGCTKPDGLPLETWTQFQAYLRAHKLGLLLSRFEWCHSASSFEAIGGQVLSALLERDDVRSREHATEIYERLFLHVFKLLATKSPRTLCSSELATIIQDKALDERDARLLGLLKTHFLELESRVAGLEKGQRSLLKRVTKIETGRILATIRSRLRIGKELPRHQPCRAQTAHTIASELPPGTKWVAIHGTAGVGKSTLARQVCESLDGELVWLRLTGSDELADEQLLSSALDDLSQASAHSGSCHLLLIDDLPRFSGRSAFSDLLGTLLDSPAFRSVEIVSTSCHKLPARLRREDVKLLQAPALTTPEVVELLRSFGAPEPVAQSAAGLLNSLCAGHAALLEGGARFLREQEWALNEASLRELLAGAHTVETNIETTTRLLKEVPEVETQELAYRVRLVRGELIAPLIDAVAAVEHAIGSPRARIRTLEGMWLSPSGRDRWHISPLLRAIDDEVLSEETRLACHSALAWTLLRPTVVDAFDVRRALRHLQLANDETAMAAVLARTYLEVAYSDEGPTAAQLNATIGRFELSTNVALSHRLHVASLRAVALHAVGAETQDALETVLSLLKQAGDDEAWAILAATASIVPRFGREEPEVSLVALSAALRLEGKLIHGPDGAALDLDLPGIAPLLWSVTESLEGKPEAVTTWFSILEGVSEEQMRAFLDDDFAEGAALMFSATFWLSESKKKDEEQDWDALVAKLAAIETRAQSLDLQALVGAFGRAQVLVIGEHQRKVDDAIALGQEKLRMSGELGIFFIGEELGRLLVENDRLDDARGVLDAVVSARSALRRPPLFALRSQSLRYHAEAWAATDGDRALESSRAAVAEASASPVVPVSELVKANGEHAMALWALGRKHEAFVPLSTAAHIALDADLESEEVRRLIILLAHVASFMTADVARGIPPQKTTDGSAYHPPTVGWFRSYPDISAYQTDHPVALASHLVLYAHAVGSPKEAVHWASRASDLLHRSNARMSLGPFVANANAYLLLDGQVEDVLHAAFTIGRQMSAELAEIRTKTTGETWGAGERTAVLLGFTPAAVAAALSATRNRADGEQLVRLLQRACKRIGEDSGENARWEFIEKVLGDAFGDAPLRDAIEELNSLGNTDEDHLVRAACLLVASFHPEARLDWIAQAQSKSLAFMHQMWQSAYVVADVLLVPFLTSFWEQQLKERAFLMRAPRSLRDSLGKARDKPTANEAVFEVLAGIRTALGVS